MAAFGTGPNVKSGFNTLIILQQTLGKSKCCFGFSPNETHCCQIFTLGQDVERGCGAPAFAPLRHLNKK